jgi:hypothetical protein
MRLGRIRAVLYLRWIVAGFSPWRTRFITREVLVGFVVKKSGTVAGF